MTESEIRRAAMLILQTGTAALVAVCGWAAGKHADHSVVYMLCMLGYGFGALFLGALAYENGRDR